MQRPADLTRQVIKKMSRWSNPTRRRNRIPAEIILITSVGLCAAVDGHCCSLLTPMETPMETALAILENKERKIVASDAKRKQIATEDRTRCFVSGPRPLRA
jgi:hypothetical protein